MIFSLANESIQSIHVKSIESIVKTIANIFYFDNK